MKQQARRRRSAWEGVTGVARKVRVRLGRDGGGRGGDLEDEGGEGEEGGC